MTDAAPSVGIIGVGAMGSAFAHHLMQAGFDVFGYDVSADRLAAFAAAGGHPTELPDLAQHCRIMILSLPSGAAAREVICGGETPGLDDIRDRILVEASTLSVEDKLDLAELAQDRGALMLDCPVSGTSEQAWNRDLVAYVSGDQAAKDLALPVIRAFTRGSFDVGELGNGTRVKLVANLLVAIHNVAAAEALLLAERAGLDLEMTLAALVDGAGNSRMLQVRGPRMITEDFLPATMRVSLFRKDIALIRGLEASLGLATPLLAAVADVYAEAESRGLGDQDTACAVTVLRDSARQVAGHPPGIV